mmetsp:Transcript_3994/g.11106  ORF Transcript_3994/g.11106 Transcript_3994/m.11106 type:complete len:261 (-) Transcript_3994:160-942(-)
MKSRAALVHENDIGRGAVANAVQVRDGLLAVSNIDGDLVIKPRKFKHALRNACMHRVHLNGYEVPSSLQKTCHAAGRITYIAPKLQDKTRRSSGQYLHQVIQHCALLITGNFEPAMALLGKAFDALNDRTRVALLCCHHDVAEHLTFLVVVAAQVSPNSNRHVPINRQHVTHLVQCSGVVQIDSTSEPIMQELRDVIARTISGHMPEQPEGRGHFPAVAQAHDHRIENHDDKVATRPKFCQVQEDTDLATNIGTPMATLV